MARQSSGELKQLVRRIYREQVERGSEFHLATVRDVALEESQALAASSHELAVDAALRDVDEEESRGADTPPQGALPGFRVDRVYRLGEGRRQPEVTAMVSHAQEHIAIQRKHANDAKASADRELDEYIALSPYWGAGVTKQEAIRAYERAQEADHG